MKIRNRNHYYWSLTVFTVIFIFGFPLMTSGPDVHSELKPAHEQEIAQKISKISTDQPMSSKVSRFGFDSVVWNSSSLKSWWSGQDKIKKLKYLNVNTVVVSMKGSDLKEIDRLTEELSQQGVELILSYPLSFSQSSEDSDIKFLRNSKIKAILFELPAEEFNLENERKGLLLRMSKLLPKKQIGFRFYNLGSITGQEIADFALLDLNYDFPENNNAFNAISLQKLISEVKARNAKLKVFLSIRMPLFQNGKFISAQSFQKLFFQVSNMGKIEGLFLKGLGLQELDYASPDLHEVRAVVREGSKREFIGKELGRGISNNE